ncbi:putative bifunctional diguanylate cyclase/phosphodiesterase [Aeromicrobium yanjiei]|uniref:EAL domain-containing protein n=1 Tax=Aeromicrobium yanjiei TaxID=2662028 RepID=A0A5Q2MJ90_9ACTN|nr:EAL domain-containing protein [Aeromicrobium yanjiei]QGG41791.1 EAL domain-containing protein [Aeromicrobium yanjiei]
MVVERADDETTMLRQIIEATPNAMLMVDPRGRITLVNSQTESLFGYSREEMLAMSIEDLIPERLRARHRSTREGFFAAPARRGMGAGRELFGRRRDGSEVPVEIGLNPIHIRDEQHVLASVIDITERLLVQAVESAKNADHLRRSILDSLPFSIIASDPDGTIVTANPAAERLLGFSRGELVGTPIRSLRQGASSDMPLLATRPDAVDEREVDYLRKDGSTIPVNEAISLIASEDAEVTGFLSVAYDITQRRQAEAFIRHVAHYDFLTDLPNRTKLFERLDHDLRLAVRHGRGVAVAMVDIDHFKRVNDSLGHHVGDEMLVKVAERLRGHMGPDDMVARLGGDEFVLVLTGIHSEDQVEGRISRVLADVLEPMVCSGHELTVTASIGVAMFPLAGSDPTTLLKHADAAMYQAKTSARNSHRYFDFSMLDATNDKLAIAAGLRHALDRDEISVAYQTQISLVTDEVIGVEALARWHTSDGREITPDLFIPAAEDNGLIIALGERVLRQACVDTVTMSREMGRPLKLAVNVSPRQFNDRSWLDVMHQALRDSELPADRLELEITEGIFMENPAAVVEVMNTVRSLGVGIVIDDFGTGFSSLAYLTRFPIDKIKIDRSFIADVVVDAADAAIVNSIIVMAHTLGMTVVGEGVETDAQESYLRERGCDEAQGFRYSHALPPLDVVAAARG